MSLSIALEQARAALTQQALRAEITSTNIVNAQNPGYHRRAQAVSSDFSVGLSYVTIREVNAILEREMLAATAQSTEGAARSDILSQISSLLADPGNANSLPSRISVLNSSLTQFASEPSSEAFGRAVITAASNVVSEIRLGSNQVATARDTINSRMKEAAAGINALLSDLARTESQINISGVTTSGVNELKDQRDRILGQISQIMSIRVVTKPDQSLGVYADSGITLYDRIPREVSTSSHFDAESGGEVTNLIIDGLDATGPDSIMPIKSGVIFGLIQSREQVLKPAAIQLDEITRVLVDIFADTDASDPVVLPKIQGLFAIEGSNGQVLMNYTAGISSRLSINENVLNGYNPVALLRDGGLGQPGNSNYNHNSAGLPGFQSRLESLLINFNATVSFQNNAMVESDSTLESFSANASAWINGISRSTQSNQLAAETALTYVQKKIAEKTGVNLDDETARMLDIQRSYQVTGKMIAILDDMFNTLLNRIN